MIELKIKVHEIAIDGLPKRDRWDSGAEGSYIGRVAFLFDGCIVSGWPLYPEDHPDLYHPARVERRMNFGRGGAQMTPAQRYQSAASVQWEANSDVGHGRLFSGVTHWVEFPHAWWDILTSPAA